MGDKMSVRDRLNELPDTHRLKGEDLPLVQAALGKSVEVGYTTANQAFQGFKAYGKTFFTVGELRKLALERPPHHEQRIKGALGLAEQWAAMAHRIALVEVRGLALRDLLVRKGLVTAKEWADTFEQIRNRDFWPIVDFMRLTEVQFGKKWATWIAGQSEAYSHFRSAGPLPEPGDDEFEDDID